MPYINTQVGLLAFIVVIVGIGNVNLNNESGSIAEGVLAAKTKKLESCKN